MPEYEHHLRAGSLSEPIWVEAPVVYRIHEMPIIEYGEDFPASGGTADRIGPGKVKTDVPLRKPDVTDLAATCPAGLPQNEGFLNARGYAPSGRDYARPAFAATVMWARIQQVPRTACPCRLPASAPKFAS